MGLSSRRSTLYRRKLLNIKLLLRCKRRIDLHIWQRKKLTEQGRSNWEKMNIENQRMSITLTDQLSTWGPKKSREASMRSSKTVRESNKWKNNTKETFKEKLKLIMPLSTQLQTRFFMIGLIKILTGHAKISELFKRGHQIIIFTILRLGALLCLKYSLNSGLLDSRHGKVSKIKWLKFGKLLEVILKAKERSH